tara:strand:+ start:4118 stop:4864 length:747 start_codon:yes stop_codon:yes gene_type:complete
MSRKAKLLEKTKMFKVLERNEIFTETQLIKKSKGSKELMDLRKKGYATWQLSRKDRYGANFWNEFHATLGIRNQHKIEGEKWRPAIVNGVEYKEYFVSNMGRTATRVMPGPKAVSGYNKDYFKILKQYGTSNKYRTAVLKLENKVINIGIQRLVAMTWLDSSEHLPPNTPLRKNWDKLDNDMKVFIMGLLIVDHINGKRDDNRVSNLRWATQKQNCNFWIKQKGGHRNETINKMDSGLCDIVPQRLYG